MKHLSKYKLFEKLVDETTIKYILMDLTDNGYKVIIDHSTGYQQEPLYTITIQKNIGFSWKDAESAAKHLENYMNSEGYTLSRMVPAGKDRVRLHYKFSSLALLKAKTKP